MRELVVEAAASDTISQIAKPSGRNLSEERKRRAAWFNGLSADERANVEYVVADAARITAFGLFCVLDGSRVIENGPNRGHLELRYISAKSEILLASSTADMPVLPLHELI
ncbi:hypothetical protein [Croceibacterium mercuriale]|uniref:hypothetical protein n=1 Tax=Croceibacterium mercuriale TaxID=1572751 RepID=UPI00126A73D4|nr:hypothetical protein [Croceibacterium mercuriale]